MLCRIEIEDKKIAREILELLSFSLKPMTLNEICEFLQITEGMTVLDDNKKLTDPKDVRVSRTYHSIKLTLA